MLVRVVYCVVMDPAPSQRHDKIGMMTAQHRVGPCRYRDGGGKWANFTEVGHVGFPTAMLGDASDPEFYLRESVVRPSATPPLRQPVRPSARPPIVRPRPLVRLPVRLSARPLGALVRLCARPPTRPPRPPHISRGP